MYTTGRYLTTAQTIEYATENPIIWGESDDYYYGGYQGWTWGDLRAGIALQRGVLYYWRVRYWNNIGVLIGWSDVNFFSIVPISTLVSLIFCSSSCICFE